MIATWFIWVICNLIQNRYKERERERERKMCIVLPVTNQFNNLIPIKVHINTGNESI
jgi:hypothetical protein